MSSSAAPWLPLPAVQSLSPRSAPLLPAPTPPRPPPPPVELASPSSSPLLAPVPELPVTTSTPSPRVSLSFNCNRMQDRDPVYHLSLGDGTDHHPLLPPRTSKNHGLWTTAQTCDYFLCSFLFCPIASRSFELYLDDNEQGTSTMDGVEGEGGSGQG